jgi:RNA polymerase sigma factor (sigma-70 family)
MRTLIAAPISDARTSTGEERKLQSEPRAAVRECDLSIYAPALKRFFRKRVAASEIDDLTQDVFLNMHSRRSQTQIENLEGYLFSVAAHLLARYHTRRRAQGSIAHATANIELQFNQAPSAEDEVLAGEKLQRLVSAVQELPPCARKVFLLHRFEAMTYEAIAQRHNISVSAIEKHIMSALKAIRSQVCGDS